MEKRISKASKVPRWDWERDGEEGDMGVEGN